MKSPLMTALILLLLAFATTAVASEFTSAERAALAGQSDAGVATLRAGETVAAPLVAGGERDVLTAAAASAPELEALRAGEVSDDDILVGVGVAVGVIVLAIIIF